MASQYLKIENPGFASAECFTMLGVSTTRLAGSLETIGMFGSGFKHGINCCLRDGVTPVIFSNLLKMEFFAEKMTVKDGLSSNNYRAVWVKFTGKDDEGNQINRKEKLGWTLEYGENDWTNIGMAIREFVANSLDRTVRQTKKFDDTVIEMVEENQVRAKAGKTRIFVEAVPSVAKYYKELDKRFLHTTKSQDNFGILQKKERSLNGSESPMIYKKGVYVNQPYTMGVASLFDYNFGGDLDLDECRNSDPYAMKRAAAARLFGATPTICENVLTALKDKREFWEGEFTEWHLTAKLEECEKEYKPKWQNAFRKVFGQNAVLVTEGNIYFVDALTKKGYIPVSIKEKYKGWFEALKKTGIPTHETILSRDEMEGVVYHEVPQIANQLLHDLWMLLVSFNMTREKTKPPLKVYTKLVEQGSRLLGYYKEGTVYVHQELTQGNNKLLANTIMEEVAHYITGATDNSRDFQEFYMTLTTELIWKILF